MKFSYNNIKNAIINYIFFEFNYNYYFLFYIKKTAIFGLNQNLKSSQLTN